MKTDRFPENPYLISCYENEIDNQRDTENGTDKSPSNDLIVLIESLSRKLLAQFGGNISEEQGKKATQKYRDPGIRCSALIDNDAW